MCRAFHDLCGENDMPAEIEMGKHHFAHACENRMCNVAAPDYDGSVCVAEDDGGAIPTPPGPVAKASKGSRLLVPAFLAIALQTIGN